MFLKNLDFDELFCIFAFEIYSLMMTHVQIDRLTDKIQECSRTARVCAVRVDLYKTSV